MGATSVTGVSGIGTVAGSQKGSEHMSLGVEKLIGPRVVAAGHVVVGTGNGGTSATVTFTVDGDGGILAVTATPAANATGWPVDSTVFLLVTGGGGTGGVVWGSTDGSGVLTFETTPLIAGSGYSAGSGRATAMNTAVVILPESTVGGDAGLLDGTSSYIATANDTAVVPAAANVAILTQNYLVLTGTATHTLNWMIVKAGL